MEKHIIKIPTFIDNKKGKLLDTRRRIMYKLLDIQHQLSKIDQTEKEKYEQLCNICDGWREVEIKDATEIKKKRLDLYRQLIGKYWLITNEYNHNVGAVFPYEVGEKTNIISSLYVNLSPYEEGYSGGISTEHINISDGLWANNLTFNEISKDEFESLAHKRIDDVLSSRYEKIKQPKPNPNFKVTWKS